MGYIEPLNIKHDVWPNTNKSAQTEGTSLLNLGADEVTRHRERSQRKMSAPNSQTRAKLPKIVRLRHTLERRQVLPASHPLQCGRKMVLYDTCDMVGPIIDSILELGASIRPLYLMHRKHKLQLEKTFVESQRNTDTDVIGDEYGSMRLSKVYKSGELCSNCHTTNRDSQRVDHKTNRLVCQECGAEGGVYEARYDYCETKGPNARADDPTKGTSACDVPQLFQRSSASQNNASAPKEPVPSMSNADSRKITLVTAYIDRFVTQLPHLSRDSKLRCKLHTDAFSVFVKSVKHSQVCNRTCCQKSLSSFPAPTIARESFGYSIDKMCAEGGFPGYSRQNLLRVQEEVKTSPVFNGHDNNIQFQSCRVRGRVDRCSRLRVVFATLTLTVPLLRAGDDCCALHG